MPTPQHQQRRKKGEVKAAQSIDISDLAAGIYFVAVKDDEGNSAVVKFVKE